MPRAPSSLSKHPTRSTSCTVSSRRSRRCRLVLAAADRCLRGLCRRAPVRATSGQAQAGATTSGRRLLELGQSRRPAASASTAPSASSATTHVGPDRPESSMARPGPPLAAGHCAIDVRSARWPLPTRAAQVEHPSSSLFLHELKKFQKICMCLNVFELYLYLNV
jgi:hypothetical protein